MPGARYVDIFHTINNGRYSDELKIDGERVLARQADGVHFTREGAVVPVRLIFAAMARDYQALREEACAAFARSLLVLALAWPRRPARTRSAAACSSTATRSRWAPQPYLPRELARWRVTQSTAISRHAFEGADVMRAYGRALPRVIHVSLGTNDDPRSLEPSAPRSAR